MTDSNPRFEAALADRYRLLRILGEGGMATVFLAHDIKHHRQVALKLFRSELSSYLGPDRFEREVEIAAQLNHPHILPLYDSGCADGFLFYVMPYVTGESLRAKLDREAQLPIDEALSIARQIASALGHAHSKHVIHRDVKPENVMLYEGEAMVADFGIAINIGKSNTRLTAQGLIVGTPAYMSPEQAMSEENVDARSDVYSLGCVLFEMLAGELPFSAPNPQALLTKRLLNAVPSVRPLRPAVPANIDQALTKALAKLPADRFASTSAFMDALVAPASAMPAAVAILPFVSLSADPENEYFADGITEDVIAHLSKLRSIKVISRTSVMSFRKSTLSLKEIAARLGATTVLEGSVRRVGERVRIVAQLIDVETDQHLWVETYDRQQADIFDIQTDVALQIASALKAELSVDEESRMHKGPTKDLEAYKLYLQGRHWLAKYTAPAMQQSIAYFERAIKLDPQYALAYASMAMVYAELGEVGALPPEIAFPRAKAAGSTALELDPMLSEAHTTMAYLYTCDFSWAQAEREFGRALELSPGNADTYDLYGRMCSAMERFDESITLLQRAQELDPIAHQMDVATAFLRAGRYAEAQRGAERAVEFSPELDRAHATLGWSHFYQGRVDAGIAALERAVLVSAENPQWMGQLGLAYGLAGKTGNAREILARMEERAKTAYVSPYHLVFVHSGLGEQERAMDLLEQAVDQRSGAAYAIKGSFLLAPLRSNPRFKALLAKMNLA